MSLDRTKITMSILNTIKSLCQTAVTQAFINQSTQIPDNIMDLTEATQKKFGHYQCNSAMKLSKILQLPPITIADLIKTELLKNDANASPMVFKQIDIVPPGFINFTLHEQYLEQYINKQLRDPRQGVALVTAPQKVIVDFSSPNIAKEMHVGHLRSTIIGDCIARLLTFVGHEVLRLNHIGDWGTQFGMLIAYLKDKYQDPMHLKLDLSELATCYKAAKEKFDADPAFKTIAQQEVVALQGGDAYARAIWHKLCDTSKLAYQEIYQLLDIEITDRGESFYNPLLADVVKELAVKNLLTTSDGATCVYVDGLSNRQGEPLPLIVKKSDGGYNYATTDLAAIKHRAEIEKGDWLIYVTDAGQSQHFQMVFQVARKADLCDPNVKLDHVPFGLVLRGDGKKFKTRSGDTEKLMDLLTTAITKAKILLQARNQALSAAELDRAAKHLGLNAVKYSDLSNNRINNYTFNYENMLQFEGNTAAFLSYAAVRIKSIQRKTQTDIANLLTTSNITLQEPAEIELALHACKFEDAIIAATKELLPNRLTDYLFNLAEKFHAFFHQCRVTGTPEQNSRLLLCEAVAQILTRGFHLLGLTPLEQM